jgi:hypothetical protein
MLEKLPEKARLNGLLIAVDCVDLINDCAFVRHIGSRLALRNIGMALDDVDAQGAARRPP